METKFQNFKNQNESKKGDIGEKIIDEMLEKDNLIIYKPINKGNHPFDRFVIDMKYSTKYIVDVKTKACRNKFNDTGMNYNHFENYRDKGEKWGMRVAIYFVDEMSQAIYGNFLDELMIGYVDKSNKSYPSIEIGKNGIKTIYFSLEKMIFKRKLTEQECKEIKKFNTRNYKYNKGEYGNPRNNN